MYCSFIYSMQYAMHFINTPCVYAYKRYDDYQFPCGTTILCSKRWCKAICNTQITSCTSDSYFSNACCACYGRSYLLNRLENSSLCNLISIGYAFLWPISYLLLPPDSIHDDVIKWKYFRATGHLCGEFTGHRWIPHTKASDTELWCFLDLYLNERLSKQSWGWWFETPSRSLLRHCNDKPYKEYQHILEKSFCINVKHGFACMKTIHFDSNFSYFCP